MNPLWNPSKERIEGSNFKKYFSFLQKTRNLSFKNYEDLYAWSVKDLPAFWESIWTFCDIKGSPYSQVMGKSKMPGTEWFKGTKLNFAKHLLRFQDDHEALVAVGERGITHRLSYRKLFEEVSKCALALKKAGVHKEDRVAAFIPNIPEAVIGMLATSSLGAIWSSCSPDFGIKGVLDRFGQIEPTVLLTADGYTYNGKPHDSLERVRGIIQKLPSVKKVIVVPYLNQAPNLSGIPQAKVWSDFLGKTIPKLSFEELPFNHPLYIMYSSGTTGIPKCIVHGQGGTLLQHLKELILHADLKREDRICYITTCGWMMWNWLVSSLAVGATVVLTEGSPIYPGLHKRWQMVTEENISIFGLSPKFVSLCESEGICPKKFSDFASLKTILSTGSPLSEGNFRWIYDSVKSDLQLSSISGGTDIISCFMLGNPLLPVYGGEIQCRGLGMNVQAFDDCGKPVLGQKGELVCLSPFPSMPIYFWNDLDQKKYENAYFNKYPGVWHHGDYIEITEHGGVIVYGRSDATLNPGGVRIGTAEIYRQIEDIAEIRDSIVVGQNWKNDVRIILFVLLNEGQSLTLELISQIKQKIKTGASPRHVPSKIIAVRGIPYTISGKKVEMAVSKIIHGKPVENKDALVNPEVLEFYKNRKELKN